MWEPTAEIQAAAAAPSRAIGCGGDRRGKRSAAPVREGTDTERRNGAGRGAGLRRNGNRRRVAERRRGGTMDDFQAGEETSFVVDEVSNIIKEAIESAIGGNAYQHSKVNQWTTSVVEQSLSQLTKLGKPFKYIVTCVIMQKNGAGLHTASSCFWDNSSDGTCTVRWENKTMYCIVSAFGLAI